MTTPTDHPFEFVLMRAILVDADGNRVNEEAPDPDAWALADELRDANAPPDIVHVGRGRLVVISKDERDFVREKFCMEPKPTGQYVRAAMTMDQPAEREPGCGDLVAVLLGDRSAVVYQVLLSAADLEADLAAYPPEPGSVLLITIPTGEAILELRADLDLSSLDPDTGGNSTAEGQHGIH